MTDRSRAASSMWALYRAEVETHVRTLNDSLLALEQSPETREPIDAAMRAAHSIKGAARVVRHDLASRVAHAMEDRLVAARDGRRALDPRAIQLLLDAADLLIRISPDDENEKDAVTHTGGVDAERLIEELPSATATAPAAVAGQVEGAGQGASAREAGEGKGEGEGPAAPGAVAAGDAPASADVRPATGGSAAVPGSPADAGDRSIRLTAHALTRLMGLAGEALVSMRGFEPFAAGLAQLKRQLTGASQAVEQLAEGIAAARDPAAAHRRAVEVQHSVEQARAELTELMASLETFALRQETLSSRLYNELFATRMRPFSELVDAVPRLVRDVSRELGKKVRVEVHGPRTQVDRDVAALLDAPLIHAVRNAIDHGIEPPEARIAAGKPEMGTLRVSAWHRSGMLRLEVSDDGRGVDLASLRERVVERRLTDEALAGRLSEQELLAFLFLPGFTTATRVTDLSGRGVGLDVVKQAVKEAGGRVELINRPGAGLTLRFDLPLTLSVMRGLIVEVAGEPYAIPLTRLERVLVTPREAVRSVEGRGYVTVSVHAQSHKGDRGDSMHDMHVGLVAARQILGTGGPEVPGDGLPVVVVRDGDDHYGLVVDRLVGERSVVVRPIDARLGKVKDISATGTLGDGTPLLVLDVDDMIRSIDAVLKGGKLEPVRSAATAHTVARKRILVVDDSITVREVERQLLQAHGYDVDVAVDGIDGWNAVRSGRYDLVVSDIDMPRLDGIDLVRRIRSDRRFETLPVMIVLYKDREEDRLRGLDAGASYYLPKASFQDDTFLHAVDELIGAPLEP